MNQQNTRDKLIYLRQWVGSKVSAKTADQGRHEGVLTNIVFDGSRLMYIMLDDRMCLNFDHVIEVRLA